jgi:hypothetical protein
MKKLNLGSVGESTKKKGKTDYPVVPDIDGEVATLADLIIDLNAKKKAIDGALKVAKGQLVPVARKFFIETSSGKSDISSSVEAKGVDGSVLCVMQNRYSGAEDDVVLAKIIGKVNLNRYFHQHFEVKVDGDKVPEGKAQSLLDEMAALFEKYGCSDALSAKASVVPKPEFHEARHMVLNPDQNFLVDDICPSVVAIKERK